MRIPSNLLEQIQNERQRRQVQHQLESDADIAPAFRCLFTPARYKVFYGGRGGSKSWNIARGLLKRGARQKLRILCAREIQNSIADSVHKLLRDQIAMMNMQDFYYVTNNGIRGRNGTEIFYKGLRHNLLEIKSTEGVDICWVEEAQSVSENSWRVLIPTIRKPESEIWVSFNPMNLNDPTYQRFVEAPPANGILKNISWRDNPYFPDVLREEMEALKERDYPQYLHVWEGHLLEIPDSIIFKNYFVAQEFETPVDARFFHGVDWGFANDPTVLVRSFIKDKQLFIDAEAYGLHTELDNTAELFDKIPTARKWQIKADCSRPESIAFMKRRKFRISGAKKWQGSVEDGIEYLKSFKQVVIHPRCTNTLEEFSMYAYKVDPQTNEVLPVIIDKYNHCIDAIRYSLDGYIRHGTCGTGEAASSGGSRIAPHIFD